MKLKHVPIAVFTAAIGAITVTGAGAQTPRTSTAPAYYISEFELTDPEGIKPYSARVESTFKPYGGRYIVRGGKIDSREGDAPKGRIVVIAFDSMEKAQAWYDSAAYREIKPIRLKSTKSRVFIVEGKADQ
ncbi:MAG TPA: DUF1330 domain-containing protein [Oxalobacteraceae bacterium]|nr:DUF1330 domain-containing protein [Oxalobacteraceae bacterium]